MAVVMTAYLRCSVVGIDSYPQGTVEVSDGTRELTSVLVTYCKKRARTIFVVVVSLERLEMRDTPKLRRIPAHRMLQVL